MTVAAMVASKVVNWAAMTVATMAGSTVDHWAATKVVNSAAQRAVAKAVN